MTKDRLTEMVEYRIKTEFRKYGSQPEMNWELIAAKKIVGTFLYLINKGGMEITPKSEKSEEPAGSDE
jgi:hypothetical protein